MIFTSGARIVCEVAATGSANAAWAPAVRSVDLLPGEDFKTPALRLPLPSYRINFVKGVTAEGSRPLTAHSVQCEIFSSKPVKTLKIKIDYDPSAGSPTETLLRLLLPLKDQVRPSFSSTVS